MAERRYSETLVLERAREAYERGVARFDIGFAKVLTAEQIVAELRGTVAASA